VPALLGFRCKTRERLAIHPQDVRIVPGRIENILLEMLIEPWEVLTDSLECF
jgi:hypothetical protein